MILISPSGDRIRKLGAFAKYVPLSAPYGIGALAGYLQSRGKTVEIIDEEIEKATPEKIRKKLQRLDPPYLVGLSCLTAGIARAMEIAKMIKQAQEFSDVTVIFGGIHPTVLPEEILNSGYADIVVRNEGEMTLDTLHEKIKGRKDFSDLNGISYLDGNRIVHNDAAGLVDLNTLPSFPYDLFHKYSPRYALGFITSSRGCPFDCTFCSQRSISGHYYRYRSPQIVVKEIEYLYRVRGRRYITFQDDNFLPNKKRAMELCEQIIRKFDHKIHFDCQARADNVDDEVLAIMKRAGFRLIHLGIECGSDRLLAKINKGETLEQITSGAKLIKQNGMQVSGTFILGLPTETPQERAAAYQLAKRLELDYVRFNNATPYPGTKLFEMAQKQGRFCPGENWEFLNACGSLAEHSFMKNTLSYVPEGTTEEELRLDIIKYNMFFSLRPKRVFRLLFSRVGPAGWFELPVKWFFKPGEWYSLIRFCFKIGINFTLLIAGILKHKFKSSPIHANID